MLQIEIRVEESIDERWSEWLDGLVIAHVEAGPNGTGGGTVLSGPIADQAALYGLIAKLRDLGLSLLSFKRVAAGGKAGARAR
jgi:hypothetical protein